MTILERITRYIQDFLTPSSVVTIRASSLPELFDCPARWEAKYLRGMFLPSSGAAQLGTAIHAGAAAFDAAAVNGNPITADDAAGATVDAIHKPGTEVVWDELTPQAAEKIALNLHGKYCREVAPKQTYIGVEVPCERVEITDLGLAFTGTTDRVRVVEEDGAIGITDLKSGARAVGSNGKVNVAPHLGQLGVYELLTGQALGIPMTAPAQVVGLQTGKTPATQRIALGAGNAKPAMFGDEERPGLLHMASAIVHSGLFYGNPRSYLCSAKYCPAHGSCRFRG